MAKKKTTNETYVEVSAFSDDILEGFETLDSTFTTLSAESGELSGLAAVIGREYTGPHGSWEEHVRKVNLGLV